MDRPTAARHLQLCGCGLPASLLEASSLRENKKWDPTKTRIPLQRKVNYSHFIDLLSFFSEIKVIPAATSNDPRPDIYSFALHCFSTVRKLAELQGFISVNGPASQPVCTFSYLAANAHVNVMR